jgi:hypothetical protein
MLRSLIKQLTDVYKANGDMPVGMFDEHGVIQYFKGFTIVPPDMTLLVASEDEEIIRTFHMQTKSHSLIMF